METRPVGSLVLIFAVVVLIRLPFLHQAIQGDDDTYLAEASHALIDPLHPSDVRYVFEGRAVDLRGHTHPPANAWPLAGLILLFGEVKEVPFHAVYLIWSLIAAWAMWSLAQRFSPNPVWATLLFIATPAFVVNGNSLEADLPFLAMWLASIALFTGRTCFSSSELFLAVVCMALAAVFAYQAVLLIPILAAYLWMNRSRERAAWLAIFTPLVVIAAWQVFTRLTTGSMPATVLAGYLSVLETLEAKAKNALMLFIHSWFLVFPALLPPALMLAWRKRREPETRFLLAWIVIFFACAAALFFAGAARYLLPMAAPVALLASGLRPKWLAPACALQLALGLALAAANYQHMDGYRQFAAAMRGPTSGHRVWVNGEWGLRTYFETQGALPLTRNQILKPGDVVITSQLTKAVDVTAPVTTLAHSEIRPSVPLRLIGMETHSGWSTSLGFWPFGISAGVVDRLRADLVGERHATAEYLALPSASEQIVSGIWPDGWMARNAVVLLKTPTAPARLEAKFFIPDQAAARRVELLLDGRTVAATTFGAPGLHTLSTAALYPAGPTATVEIRIDKTFTAPPDTRDLGMVLAGVGFVP
ncbi:MAG TPA: glycosyltransferase family 39 protein [Bryobacteraceae bacterium]|nr:glycosyltransferase family 39 protein [Bryobacteraceae bacterium]